VLESMLSDTDHFQSGAGVRETGEFSLFTRRITLWNPRGCGIVFGLLAVFSLAVAAVFAALGAWPILPFAGLEAMALYVAFSWTVRHAEDSESLVIRGNDVMLSVREAARTRNYEFNRAWARLVVEQHAGGIRLALRSHGREIQVGRYLDSGGRQRLARELKDRLQAH
jgi:uncharacterized membrane protein